MIGDDENLVTLSDAAKQIPNRTGGRGVNLSTIWRWALKGCRGIVLESRLFGGVRYTSQEALERFFNALTLANSGGGVPAVSSAKSAVRQRDAELARKDAQLAAAGW